MLRHNSLVRVIDGARKSLSAFFEKFLERRLTQGLSGGGGVHEGRAGVCSRQYAGAVGGLEAGFLAAGLKATDASDIAGKWGSCDWASNEP